MPENQLRAQGPEAAPGKLGDDAFSRSLRRALDAPGDGRASRALPQRRRAPGFNQRRDGLLHDRLAGFLRDVGKVFPPGDGLREALRRLMVERAQLRAVDAGLRLLLRREAVADKVPVRALRECLQPGDAHDRTAVERAGLCGGEPSLRRFAQPPRDAGKRLPSRFAARERGIGLPFPRRQFAAPVRRVAKARAQRLERRLRRDEHLLLLLRRKPAAQRHLREQPSERLHRCPLSQRAARLIRQRVGDEHALRCAAERLEHVQLRKRRALRRGHAQVGAGRLGARLAFLRGQQAVFLHAARVVHAQRQEGANLRRAHVADLAADDRSVRRGQRGQLQPGEALAQPIERQRGRGALSAQKGMQLVKRLHEPRPDLRAVLRLRAQTLRPKRFAHRLERVCGARLLEQAHDRGDALLRVLGRADLPGEAQQRLHQQAARLVERGQLRFGLVAVLALDVGERVSPGVAAQVDALGIAAQRVDLLLRQMQKAGLRAFDDVRCAKAV